MPVEVKVPSLGESITEVYIGRWLAQEGGSVTEDAPLVEVETDKATMEVMAPATGTLARVLKQKGDSARIGEVIAYVEEGARTGAHGTGAPATSDSGPSSAGSSTLSVRTETTASPVSAKPDAQPPPAAPSRDTGRAEEPPRVMPAAQRLLDEHALDARQIAATGPGGRLLKEDVQRHLDKTASAAAPGAGAAASRPAARAPAPAPAAPDDRAEEWVPMSPLRRTIAQRLVEAQQSTAQTTTYNEIDMTGVMALRSEHKQGFEERHGVRLGLMSFFVKAVIGALRQIPQLNAEIREQSIVYRSYHDIAVAVSTPKGLVTPVLRNAERLGFAEIEAAIADFGRRAQENRLGPDELRGGTFTISNGGVFGSLLSTPLLNPPQSGVLGMHAIQERPVARAGQVVIRPMMYVALTYDHRIVDGREAVMFLKHVKDAVEAPARMLLDV
jgi:2-oxoglutarate dehydrogenase E2 component (dihydrolipoamide succinyltransferase)